MNGSCARICSTATRVSTQRTRFDLLVDRPQVASAVAAAALGPRTAPPPPPTPSGFVEFSRRAALALAVLFCFIVWRRAAGEDGALRSSLRGTPLAESVPFQPRGDARVTVAAMTAPHPHPPPPPPPPRQRRCGGGTAAGGGGGARPAAPGAAFDAAESLHALYGQAFDPRVQHGDNEIIVLGMHNSGVLFMVKARSSSECDRHVTCVVVAAACSPSCVRDAGSVHASALARDPDVLRFSTEARCGRRSERPVTAATTLRPPRHSAHAAGAPLGRGG